MSGRVDDRLHSIQILRFIAAFLVVYAHSVDSARNIGAKVLPLAPGYLENFGAIGVDIFFVISGFIITQTAYLRKHQKPGNFLKHRLLRIVPIYYLLSLPWIAVALFIHHEGIVPSRVVATFLFWPAFPAAMEYPYLFVGWTLCFEMLFYVSIAFSLTGRLRWVVAATLFAACWSYRTAGHNIPLFQFLGNPIVLEFLSGVGIALVWYKGLRQSLTIFALSFICVIVWVGYLLANGYGSSSEVQETLDASHSLQRVCLFGIPSALLVLGALQIEKPLRVAQLSLLIFLGDASYSIYLVHVTVFAVADKIAHHLISGSLGPFSGTLWMVALSAISLAIGGLVYVFLERRILTYLRKLFPDRKRKASAEAIP